MKFCLLLAVAAAACEFKLQVDEIDVECDLLPAADLQTLLSNFRPIYSCLGTREYTLYHSNEHWWLKDANTNIEIKSIASWAVSPLNFATSSPKLVGVTATRCDNNVDVNTFHVTSTEHPSSFYTKLTFAPHALYYGTTSYLFAWFQDTLVFSLNGKDVAHRCDNTRKCTLVQEHGLENAHQRMIYARNRVRSTHEFQLTNGLILPLFGMGTGMLTREETKLAIKVGYEHANYNLIDTAAIYGNEEEIGSYIQHLTHKPFIITKVWPTELGFQRTTLSILESMQRLKLGVLDIALLHWPKCYGEWNVDWMDCSTADQDLRGDLWLESWRAMEKMYAEGLIYAIGVSNFNSHLLHIATDAFRTSVNPHIVQNHFSVDNLDLDVVLMCKEMGIYYQSYALIRNGIPDFIGDGSIKPFNMSNLEFLIQIVIKAEIGVLLRSSNEKHLIANAQFADKPLIVEYDVLQLAAATAKEQNELHM